MALCESRALATHVASASDKLELEGREGQRKADLQQSVQARVISPNEGTYKAREIRKRNVVRE